MAARLTRAPEHGAGTSEPRPEKADHAPILALTPLRRSGNFRAGVVSLVADDSWVGRHQDPRTIGPVSSDLKARIQADLNAARKQRDRARTLVLSTTLSEIRNREIEVGASLDDDEVVRVVSRAVKQRREASEQMRRGGREELARKEDDEATLLSTYLPEQLPEEDVRGLVRRAIEAGAGDMGSVMGRIMPEIRGRFDGKEASRIAREELGR